MTSKPERWAGAARPQARWGWLLAAALAFVAGCGGGGGTGGVDSGGTGVAPATLAVGPISGFGSIVVGGVHYDESQARLEDGDGQVLPPAALALGAVVSIDAGTITTSGTRQVAQARTVRISETLLGPLDSVDTAASILHVLGQAVVVNAGTAFDPALGGSLAALTPGQVLAVHGQLDTASGRVVATRLEARPAATAYLVRGKVTLLDRSAQRLAIGSLQVSLAEISTLPADLAVGSVVRVRLRTAAVAGVWPATALRLDGLTLPDRDAVELEGRVTAFTSAQRFSVDGVPVDASAASGSGTVALGVRVEVEGRSSNGTLIARRVEVDEEEGSGSSAIELEGRITAVDAVARTFVVRGVTAAWTDATRFESSTPADLLVGRAVSVKGRLAADRSRVEATLVHVER